MKLFEVKRTTVLFVTMILSSVIVNADIDKNDQALLGEEINLTLPVGEYEIRETEKGHDIEVKNFGHLLAPGKPMLPSKSFLVALPPGAKVLSVKVEGIGASPLPGAYRITPTPPIIPLVDPQKYPQAVEKVWEEWETNKKNIYSTDQAYPKKIGKLTGSGTLRKYSYASVSVCPFSYRPQSGSLVSYDAANIKIKYSLPPPESYEAQRIEKLKWDTLADEKASRLFINHKKIKNLYQPQGVKPEALQQTFDYVIITTDALTPAITSSGFITWKTSLGFTLRIVLLTDPEITTQPGGDLAERIRNFLRAYYGVWGMEYVLLVGDYTTIPMRYCYPDSTNHLNDAGNPGASSGENPTDYYYADLSHPDSLSWDSDRDGDYGEYGQDNPDLLAEGYVGRIPTNNTSRITYTLNKSVAFEQDTGSWKNQALHAGAFWYFENEDHSGMSVYDGATCLNLIETDIMSGWTISHYSEQEGLAPSAYDWPALTEAAFTNDWKNGEYSIVNWGAHGWVSSAARKVWSWDDEDGVPENPEISWPSFISIWSNLDDDHPCIFFPMSCVIGYPEPNAWGNMGRSEG